MRERRVRSIAALVLGLLGGAPALDARPSVARLGVLANLPPPPASVTAGFLAALRDGLKEAGFVEGTNLVLEACWEPDVGKLSGHAAGLVHGRVDAIVTFTTPATRVALSATRSIPIIFSMVSDPVGSGLVASLPGPGGTSPASRTSSPT
jgi:putative ABC transport system substrate-binding protein